VTEPVDDWDLIRERQDFALWENQMYEDLLPPREYRIIQPRTDSVWNRVSGCLVLLVIVAVGWAVLGAISWGIWRVFQ